MERQGLKKSDHSKLPPHLIFSPSSETLNVQLYTLFLYTLIYMHYASVHVEVVNLLIVL